jgi:hypothetical protein
VALAVAQRSDLGRKPGLAIAGLALEPARLAAQGRWIMAADDRLLLGPADLGHVLADEEALVVAVG